jgi:hypothetical protein
VQVEDLFDDLPGDAPDDVCGVDDGGEALSVKAPFGNGW